MSIETMDWKPVERAAGSAIAAKLRSRASCLSR